MAEKASSLTPEDIVEHMVMRELERSLEFKAFVDAEGMDELVEFSIPFGALVHWTESMSSQGLMIVKELYEKPMRRGNQVACSALASGVLGVLVDLQDFVFSLYRREKKEREGEA